MKKIMKKICIIILVLVSLFSYIEYAWAAYVEVQVTEAVPGANCGWADSNWVRTCQVQAWFWSVMELFWWIIKYFTLIASLAAVLFIVINGILYSMAGINDGLKTWAKDRIIKTLIGLVILLLSWVILNAIAPWVYK